MGKPNQAFPADLRGAIETVTQRYGLPCALAFLAEYLWRGYPPSCGCVSRDQPYLPLAAPYECGSVEALRLNLLDSQSSAACWSSIVARRICLRSSILLGLGSDVFCNPSLQLEHSALKFAKVSSPPFDLSRICPIVSLIVRVGWKGSGSPAPAPHIWQVKPLRSSTRARNSFEIPPLIAGMRFDVSNRYCPGFKSARSLCVNTW